MVMGVQHARVTLDGEVRSSKTRRQNTNHFVSTAEPKRMRACQVLPKRRV